MAQTCFISSRGTKRFASNSTGLAVLELPKDLKKYERKPWVTDINELKCKARQEKQERHDARENILKPPANGQLVKESLPIVRQVYDAKAELRICISQRLQGALLFTLAGFADRGIDAWDKMRSEAYQLMQDYVVHTGGYYSDIQVGPKGHRARNCQVYKHQMRDGQHAWQETTIDNLIPLVYVWHIRNLQDGTPLPNSVKWYYGKLPAVVEFFGQAEAQVGKNYLGIMSEDRGILG